MKIKSLKAGLIFMTAVAMICSCKESYVPPTPVGGTTNNLVVEGMINVSADSTVIRLSRTVKLTDTTSVKPELNAQLSVENDAGATYNLTSLGKGRYYATGHPLPSTSKYRLRIKTADGKTYLSDYVEAKISPPIDSVSWKAFSDRIEIYATTHDPNKASTYYKYDYTDAWEFHAAFQSQLKVVGSTIVTRNLPADDIFTCWSNSSSTLINLASSAKLSQDVIYQNRVNTIPSDAEKISVRYSILVKQRVLTKEEFDFWTNLQKNTEKLGSIFDAQPSVLSGNIHNINDANEVVVGYVTAGTEATQRIFINRSQLPISYHKADPNHCATDSLLYYNPLSGIHEVQEYILTNQQIPISGFNLPAQGIIGAPPICADCTLRGTKAKPSYW
ncbi:DUF4249 domain-containing protein [Mucilaginibacter ginkgonis]|uniref:DUF4249 domain-containing protein n=1 Tax=Mucilaginibacter ginkgonis TaxID=2682091 RepID=A0A6I4HY65_9SPHI|nr:DUF4249 domain-containing protein [Mucilaginibacter ginkgonis]QQL50450.1 DUF4249 domain-containing protein [Mucilaginibacter ginkgonis]